MNKFNRVFAAVFVMIIISFAGANVFISKMESRWDDSYKVELNRIKIELSHYEKENGTGPDTMEEFLSFTNTDYTMVTDIAGCRKDNAETLGELLALDDKEHVMIETENYYYLIEIRETGKRDKGIYPVVNGILIIMSMLLLSVLMYVRSHIIKPFNRIADLPYEIAKGNMTKPIEESKDKYFGQFIWGMNMLRENLQDSKNRELELVKEKKLLLMSISHDIKTPLSAIKLYAKAIEKNLYKDDEKKKKIGNNINRNADEIEEYISQIVTASNEEFMQFDVVCTEVYIRPVIDEIIDYYSEKMETLQIRFEVNIGENCIVYGCHDRLIEVIQNIIENAIKYGDGNRIIVNTVNYDDCYEIHIENTGCELSDSELPHLFESFFRGTNVGNNSGSGLGLYICRKLIHLMEGEILAEIITNAAEKNNGQNMRIKIILRKIC